MEHYGTKWVAYKNKEEAEGKSIALPCLRKITFRWGEREETTYELARFNKYGQIITETFSDVELEQTKERLKELQA